MRRQLFEFLRDHALSNAGGWDHKFPGIRPTAEQKAEVLAKRAERKKAEADTLREQHEQAAVEAELAAGEAASTAKEDTEPALGEA